MIRKNLVLLLQLLTIILSPLYIIRFRIPINLFNHHLLLPSTLLELMILTTLLVTAVEIVKTKTPLNKLRTKYDFLIILFVVVAIIETLVSYDKIGGLGILRAYIIEPILFYYSLVYQARLKGLKFIFTALIVTSLWLSLFAILQLFNHSLSFAPDEIAQGRVSAVYNSANALALFIGPITIISLGLFLKAKEKGKKILYLICLLLLSCVMILTKSKGGIIAECITILLFLYAIYAAKLEYLRKIWMAIPLLLISIVSIFLYQMYINYHLVVLQLKPYQIPGDTLEVRFMLWVSTIRMLIDHPLFGAGLNGFTYLYKLGYEMPTKEVLQYPHNIILNFWVELGLVGLLNFIALNIQLIKDAYKRVYTNIAHSERIYGLMLGMVLIYWFIHGIVDVPYFKNDLSLLFWIIAALLTLFVESTEVKLRD